MDLASNVQARKDANVVIEFIGRTIAVDGKQKQRSLEIIQRWIQIQRGVDMCSAKNELVLPMSEMEANDFERSCLGSDRYAKVPIGEVPLSHLERLCDQHDPRIPIRRYLLSHKAADRYRQIQ